MTLDCMQSINDYLLMDFQTKNTLDGNQIPLKIPMEYSHLFDKFIKKENIQPFVHGKLDLTSLLKLYLETLKYMKPTFQTGLNSLKNQSIECLVSLCELHLENAQELSELQKQDLNSKIIHVKEEIQRAKGVYSNLIVSDESKEWQIQQEPIHLDPIDFTSFSNVQLKSYQELDPQWMSVLKEKSLQNLQSLLSFTSTLSHSITAKPIQNTPIQTKPVQSTLSEERKKQLSIKSIF